jgi:hypothetical protein
LERQIHISPKKENSVLVSGPRQNTTSQDHSLSKSQQTTLRPKTVLPQPTTYQSVGYPNTASQLSMLEADFLYNEQKIDSNANKVFFAKKYLPEITEYFIKRLTSII